MALTLPMQFLRHRIAVLALVCLGSLGAPADAARGGNGPEVIFTFDDGPDDQHTAAILSTLKTHGVKAVFFWVSDRLRGRGATGRRALVAQAVRDGHIVGNHSASHRHLCKLSRSQAASEIDRAQHLLERVSGRRIVLFRAPYGELCPRLVRQLRSRGLSHVAWDIDPREWSHHDAAQAARHVITKLRRLRGRAVVLLHDNQASSAMALPLILNWIERENRERRARRRPPITIGSGADLVWTSLASAIPGRSLLNPSGAGRALRVLLAPPR